MPPTALTATENGVIGIFTSINLPTRYDAIKAKKPHSADKKPNPIRFFLTAKSNITKHPDTKITLNNVISFLV